MSEAGHGRWPVPAAGVALALLVVADFAVHRHPHFAVEDVLGFYAWLGLGGGLAWVGLARLWAWVAGGFRQPPSR